jgi:hypothetical protein
MCVCMYVCMCVCMCVIFMHVCVYACMYVCMYVCACMSAFVYCISTWYLCVGIYAYVIIYSGVGTFMQPPLPVSTTVDPSETLSQILLPRCLDLHVPSTPRWLVLIRTGGSGINWGCSLRSLLVAQVARPRRCPVYTLVGCSSTWETGKGFETQGQQVVGVQTDNSFKRGKSITHVARIPMPAAPLLPLLESSISPSANLDRCPPMQRLSQTTSWSSRTQVLVGCNCKYKKVYRLGKMRFIHNIDYFYEPAECNWKAGQGVERKLCRCNFV